MNNRYRQKLLKYVLAGVLVLPYGMHKLIDAYATDFCGTDGKSCTVTVTVAGDSGPGATELPPILAYDLYKVLDIKEDDHYDTFVFDLAQPLEVNGTKYHLEAYSGEEADSVYLSGIQTSDWEAIAVYYADKLKNKELENPVKRGQVGDDKTLTGVEKGLYLLVPVDGREGAELEMEDDGQGPYSIVRTDQYEYHFTPQLLTLPLTTTEADETSVHIDGYVIDEDAEPTPTPSGEPAPTATPTPHMTSDYWVDNVKVSLKYSYKLNFGELLIIKNLPDYEYVLEDGEELKTPVTFVFEVVAKNPKTGEVVFNYVTSMTFDAQGTQQELIKRIPVGSEVTVTEVYSGASYKPEPEDSDVVDGLIIKALLSEDDDEPDDNTATAEFTNKYEPSQKHGYGIKNEFSKENDGWHWVEPEEDDGGDVK